MSPACLNNGTILAGSPALVVTNLTLVVDDEIDDGGIAHEQLRDVDSPRLVGEVAHLLELELDLVELARSRSR